MWWCWLDRWSKGSTPLRQRCFHYGSPVAIFGRRFLENQASFVSISEWNLLSGGLFKFLYFDLWNPNLYNSTKYVFLFLLIIFSQKAVMSVVSQLCLLVLFSLIWCSAVGSSSSFACQKSWPCIAILSRPKNALVARPLKGHLNQKAFGRVPLSAFHTWTIQIHAVCLAWNMIICGPSH